jgi:hypothetical protein
MKKLLFSFLAMMLMVVSPIKAEANQTLIINGEVVSKVVTKITFEGDLVVLTFSDSTTAKEDMDNVVIRFTAPTSIKDLTTFQLKKAVDGSLEINGLAAGTQVYVFDAAGKQMLVTKDSTVNVSGLKSGVYVLKAGDQIVKFVKR